MGSFLEPKVQSTPAPQQADFVTQIDNVNKLKTEKVKQADGTEAIVTTRMPLSDEEQALEDKYKSIAADSLKWIDTLTNDPTASSLPWVKEYVDSYKASAMQGIDEGMTARTNQEERALGRFGQADSTAAANTRSQRGTDYSGQVAQLGRDEVAIQQEARDKALSSYGNIYSLATGSTNGLISQLQNAIGQQSSTGLAGQTAKQSYFNNVTQNTANNNNLKMQASQAGFSNLANLIALGAAPFTGGASLGFLAATGKK